ncbi:hypothetical protein L6452_28310 [Arctium lappa]|uniref:Uncharacterized protein n=1 Tax=Arctium lappa TaxID=4217 RepID=A0ACB8ZYC3_ARCLA|nr:hypothetical protein L6452_28310 [Arctium lappa]
MGQYIVRRKLDEPNKHSRLWIYKEIEDILISDQGTNEAAQRTTTIIRAGDQMLANWQNFSITRKLSEAARFYGESTRHGFAAWPRCICNRCITAVKNTKGIWT